MQLYAILRRKGWSSAAELQEAAARSTRVGNEEMPDDVRWIRSYVLDEGGGSVGTICIYEGTSPDAIREHAARAGLPGRRGDRRGRHCPRAPRPGAGNGLIHPSELRPPCRDVRGRAAVSLHVRWAGVRPLSTA